MGETKNELRTRTIAYGTPIAPKPLGPRGTVVSPGASPHVVAPRPVDARDIDVSDAATIVDARTDAAFTDTAIAPETLSPSISTGWVTPASSGALSSPSSGRTTVLPRIEMFGSETRIVSETRLRYVSDRKLGEGGLGEVLGAVDQDIGRRVAVKRLHPGARTDASLLRFADEVRTIGRLEHPNIIPIHDVGLDERGDHYFVMKYIDGETLESIIEKLAAGDPAYHATYTVERRVEIFMALLEAVAFAHSNGIIHRDIKPANVMVGAYGEVVLMDWGVAKTKGKSDDAGLRSRLDAVTSSIPVLSSESNAKSTEVGGIVGTPFYMSPEQSKGLPVDERSDVYALSLLLYEFLGLVHPLEGKKSLQEVLDAVADEPIAPVYKIQSDKTAPVPIELSHFVRHGLEKDPAKRYPNVNAMITRLRLRAAGDIPVECPVTFAKQNANMWRTFIDKHPTSALGAMMLAVLGALGFVSMTLLTVLGVLHR